MCVPPPLLDADGFAMNKEFWVYGFVLLTAMSLSAQDPTSVSDPNLGNTKTSRSIPFGDLLRQAEGGDGFAQCKVANAYANGDGVPKDTAEAVKWWLQSARNGISEAQNDVGYLYQHGIGVSQDYGEAVRWFSSAAEQKMPTAQYNLAYMYEYGEGVPVDHARAADLYGQAASQG